MTQAGAGAVATDLTALSNDEKVEILRSRMAHLVSVPDYPQVKESDSLPHPGERRSYPEEKESFERSMLEVLSLQGPLGELTSLGGLPRGAATSIADCPTALVHIIAQVTAAGKHVAVIGLSDLLWAAVSDAGGDLSLVAVVDCPDATGDADINAPDPLSVLGVLCEGMDLVIYCGQGQANVPPSLARPVMSRVRSFRCALLVCGARWPGVSLRIDAIVSAFRGLGRGRGRIRGMSVDMRVEDRHRPPQRGQWHMGVGSFAQPIRHHRPTQTHHWRKSVKALDLNAVEAAG